MAEGLFNPATVLNDRFLPGIYTVATLPPPSSAPFMYAPVSDLGGGADMVLSDGQYWKQIRRGNLVTLPANTNINVQPLISPTIFVIGGTITSAMNLIVDTNRLYPGYIITAKRQNALSTVLGLVGSLGIKTNNGNAASLALTDTSTDLMWDGTQFVQI